MLRSTDMSAVVDGDLQQSSLVLVRRYDAEVDFGTCTMRSWLPKLKRSLFQRQDRGFAVIFDSVYTIACFSRRASGRLYMIL